MIKPIKKENKKIKKENVIVIDVFKIKILNLWFEDQAGPVEIYGGDICGQGEGGVKSPDFLVDVING